jgi:hypothetical protein
VKPDKQLNTKEHRELLRDYRARSALDAGAVGRSARLDRAAEAAEDLNVFPLRSETRSSRRFVFFGLGQSGGRSVQGDNQRSGAVLLGYEGNNPWKILDARSRGWCVHM